VANCARGQAISGGAPRRARHRRPALAV